MNSKFILLLGAGVLGYMWWQSQNSLPSDAVAVSGTPLQQGQTGTVGAQTLTGPGYIYYSPSTKKYYVNSTAPTQAQLNAYAALVSAAQSAAAAPAAGGSATSPAGTSTETPPAQTSSGTQPATYATPGGGSAATPTTLSGLWNAIQQWAAADTTFTNNGGVLSNTPYHWEFYLNLIWPTAPTGMTTWPPDLSQVFPGIDLQQPMPANIFWSAMGTYLQGHGLSGFNGMGTLSSAFAVRGRGGWAA